MQQIDANGTGKAAPLIVSPAAVKVTPASLTFNPGSISSNGLITGTITLSAPAPSGGAAVVISYRSSTVLTATLPAGKTSTQFVLEFGAVSSTSTFSIDAAFNCKAVSGTISVKPTKLSLSPSTVSGEGSATRTVTLSATAPRGGAVVEIYQGDVDLG